MRKVLALAACTQIPAATPQDQLMAMNLRSLLAVVRTLGKHRIIAGGDSGVISDERIISGASRVLTDWPKNFVSLLEDLGENLPVDGKVGVRKQFGSIYHAVFKTKSIDPPEQVDFLRIAFLQFATNHWGRGCVDAKLMKNMREGLPQRYVSQTEFAARIGVDPRTAAGILKTQNAASTRLSCGKSERIIVDMERNSVPRTCPGKICRSREAAKRLWLSVSVLQVLRKMGVFEVKHLLPSRAGFHVLDIEAFETKILAAGSIFHDAAIDDRNITLRSVIAGHHDSPAIKAQVVEAILSRKLSVVGNTDGTIGGIILDRSEYEGLSEACRSRASGNARTPVAAARMLRCDPSVIPALARLGLLCATKTPVGLRVKDDSIEAFRREYISLASIAKMEGTT